MDQGVAHVPTSATREKVSAFCCAGYNQDDIAKFLDISDDTLRKYYAVELKTAKGEMIRDISQCAIALARGGSEKMIEFVLKCQGRWSYYKPPEAEGADAKQTAKSLVELLNKL